jgi:conjugal transfer ATP-binding protein TraC
MDRHTLDTLLPWYAWDEELQLVYMAHGYVGCILRVNQFSGIDDSITDEIEAALGMNLPPDTYVQFIQVQIPDVSDQIEEYVRAREPINQDEELTEEQRQLLTGIAKSTAGYYADLQDKGKPVFLDSGVPITESHVYIAVKIPVAEYPDDAQVQAAHERISAFQSSLNSFSPVRMNRAETLSLWRRFFNIRRSWEFDVDEGRLLREQVLGPGDGVFDEQGRVRIEHGDDHEDFISVLSIKGFSRPISALSTNYLTGDPLGKGAQLTVPTAIVLTVRIPDQVVKRREINSKFLVINMQARGRMAKWSPRLGMRKEGIEFLMHALDNGEHSLEMALTAVLWSRDIPAAKQASKGFMAHSQKPGFTMLEDHFLALPMFLNSLPLFPDNQSLFMTKRLKSVTNSHAAICAPVVVDWVGNVTGSHRMSIPGGGTIFFTRRGHILLFDLYASESGFNFVLVGRTRSGKSVTAQQLIVDQLSLGAQCWVIEIGRSFEKLCLLMGGDHIDLRPDMEIGLNPFSVVENLQDELDELIGIFGTMISPRGELSDEDLNIIERAIEATYGKMGNGATPTHLAQYLVAQDNEPRALVMGKMLHKFTDAGEYGHWFNRPMNVDLRGRFVNLELKELETRDHLLKVVLMQMMSAIGREIATADTNIRRRVLFVDEASVLLKINTAARFLEGLARRVAKHRGSMGLGLQSLGDLYMNEQTRVIASQTAHFLVMKQHPDVITQLEKDRLFTASAYAYQSMKSLRKTGEYAECFIMSEDAMGVGRLKLDPYRRVLYATDGPEKEEVVAAMRAGVPADQAIRDFLERHGQEIAHEIVQTKDEDDDKQDGEKDESLEYLKEIADVEAQIAVEQKAKEAAEAQAAQEQQKGKKRWKIF